MIKDTPLEFILFLLDINSSNYNFNEYLIHSVNFNS